MIKYSKYNGRLIKLVKEYPIYDRENDEDIDGHTEIGDMAVVTYSNIDEDYYELTIVSGKYIGVDTLALNSQDLEKSIFVFNKIDYCGPVVAVQGKKVNSIYFAMNNHFFSDPNNSEYFAMKNHFFPDPNDRTKNDPATIVSSKQVIGIYNQLNKDGNEIQCITSDVKDWFVKEAIDNYGWDEAKFIGNQCILENKFKK